MMASVVGGGVLGYLFHFVVSRQMPVSQYGELQSLLSLFLVFGVFNSALSYFVVKHTSIFAAHEDYEANREFAEFLSEKVSRLALALLFFLFVISPLLAKLLHFSSLVGFLVISLATFFSTLAVIYQEILRGWKEFVFLGLAGIFAALIKFAAGASLAYFFHRAAAVSFSFLLMALASWCLAKYWSGRKIKRGEKISQKKTGWKEKYFSEASLRKTAVNIFFFSLILVLVSNLDILLVKYFSSAEMTGYYGAFSLIGKIILWLNLAVVSVALPEACVDGYRGKRLDKKSVLRVYFLMTTLALGFLLTYYLAPELIINLFFGKKYVFEPHLLWLFGVMSFLLSLLTLEANLSFARHDFRVVYLLVATGGGMIGSVATYHQNLKEIVLALSLSFLAGYLSVSFLNWFCEKKRLETESSEKI